MASNPGRRLQRPPGPQIFGNAGAPEAVGTDLPRQAGRLGPALNHLPGGRPVERAAGELGEPAPRAGRPKQRAFRIGGQAGPRHICIHVCLGGMVGRHDQELAALLVQPKIRPLALGVVVGHPHRQGRTHPRKGVGHHPDQRPIAQPYQRRRINAVEQTAGFGGGQHGGLACLDHVFGAVYRSGRVGRDHLADHQTSQRAGARQPDFA